MCNLTLTGVCGNIRTIFWRRLLITNIERNFVVKKIKKYEKLSDDQKNRANSSAFGLAYCLIAIVVGICNYETFIFVLSCFASVFSAINIKNLIEALSKKVGYDLKIEELQDLLEEDNELGSR